MGIVLPQLAPASEDRVSGAQVIDSSLKFDGRSGGNHALGHLKRSSSGASGGGTFTISWWAKRGSMRDDWQYMIAGDNGSLWGVGFPGSSGDRDSLTLFNGSHQFSAARFRDNSGWYHIVLVVNANYGPKLWVNGEAQSNTNTTSSWNLNNTMYIGKWVDSGTAHNYDGYLAQYTCIDGLELGPSYFAYTDPLTGAWRPKKFRAEGTTVNDGTNWASASESGSGTVNNKSNIFDADPTTAGGSTGANTDITLTLPKSIHVKKSVRIYQNQNGTARIDSEPPVTTSSGGANWVTIFDGETEFTSLTLTSTGGDTCDIRAIEVDGVMLESNATQNLAFGSAGFYLPLDGNTPIGEDLSGNNNDWTPVGFGGSIDITKATGALPILNTTQGGTAAGTGVFGSEVSRNYTILGTSGGGLYRFDGIAETNPPLSFVRGATYIFDYSATSGSHPLAFSTTDPDSSTTSYTDGVNTATSNVTKITVPHDAPDTLYYYCTSHSNMNNAITVTTDETKADPYAWKCILAMPMISEHDVSGDMNCTTTNDAITNNSVAFNNDRSVFYNQSADPDGSQYFSGVDLSSWDIGQPWTIEFWWYRTGANTNNHGHFVGGTIGGTNQYGPTYRDGSHNDWQFNYKGQNVHITPSPALQTDKWEHHAFTSDGNNITYFRDGVFQTTASASGMTGSWGSSNEIFRGGAGWSSQYVVGHVCDMRIYAGVEKYTTAGFIPASTKPDILPESPSGVATKSKLKKITDGAVHFGGPNSGDELNINDSSDFDLSNNDFTMECFIYQNAAADAGGNSIHGQWNVGGGPSDNGYLIWVDADQKFGYYDTSDGSSEELNLQSAANTISLNRWHHVAATRSGNTFRIFVDGIQVGSTTSSHSVNNATTTYKVGAWESTTSNFPGFISDVRLVNGTALYTSNFTPPKEPLTNVTNTKLLTCQNLTTDLPTIAQSDGGLPIYNTDATGTSITSGTRTDSNSANIDIALPLNGSNGGTTFTDVSDVIRGSGSAGAVTRSGTVTSTDESLFYGSSAFFDGTNDYLEIPFPSISSTETWTIEWYQYQTADMPNPCTLCGNSGNSFFTFGTADGDKIGFNWRNSNWSNGNRFFSPSNELTVPGGLINKWVHIVYQRNSDYTISVFANGELLQKSSNTYEASLGSGSDTGATLRIGNNNSSYWFSGYLQDIRIYSGVAKYGSSNFTPPTAPILPSTVSPNVVNIRGNSAVTNFTPFNTDIDAVRGQETGYATLNPKTPIGSNCTFSNGNLDVSVGGSGSNGNRGIRGVSTIGMTSGKWYCEHVITGGATARSNIGVIGDPDYGSDDGSGNYWIGRGAKDYIVWSQGGQAYTGSSQSSSYGVGWGVGDVIGCAFDADEGKMYIYKNGIAMNGGTPSHTGLTDGPYWFIFTEQGSNISVNFGQKPFSFPPPDGFQPLTSSTARIDATDTTPTITRPDKYQGPLKYTGKPGGFQQDQNKIAFTPDMVWVKRRNAAEQHKLYDTVRGKTGSNFYHIEPNNNTAQAGESGAITEMLPGGFYATGGGHVNSDGEPFIAWMWRAGGGNTTGSSGDEFWKDGVNVGSAANAQVSTGSQNSSAYDTSDVWSDDLSSAQGAYGGSSVTNAFNGNLSNGFEAGNPSGNYSTIRFQPASAITVNTQIRIYVFDLNDSNVTYQYRVNDGSWTSMPGTSSPYLRWQDLGFTGTLNSFEYRSNTSATYKPTLYAVEIDGKMLVDSGTDLSGLTQYPSIPATACSIGTKQGFSILKWNSGGTNGNFTLAHGLGREPKFIITRSLASANTWVYHKSQVGTDYRKHLQLNSNAGGQSNSANFWGESGHTDSVYGVRVGDLIGQNQDAISYLWADVPGLQKFGSYTANGDGSGGGDEDGPFVELGFRPAMILFKGNHTSDWTWLDQERCTTNYNDVALRANYHYGEIGNARGGVGSSSQPENYAVDFLSNGFKVRASGGSINGGTNTIYYAAWAEAPQFNLYGAQSNAR